MVIKGFGKIMKRQKIEFDLDKPLSKNAVDDILMILNGEGAENIVHGYV